MLTTSTSHIIKEGVLGYGKHLAVTYEAIYTLKLGFLSNNRGLNIQFWYQSSDMDFIVASDMNMHFYRSTY